MILHTPPKFNFRKDKNLLDFTVWNNIKYVCNKELLHTWEDVQNTQENSHVEHNLILECKLKKGESCFFFS